MVRVPRGAGSRTRSGPEGSSLSEHRQAQREYPDRSRGRRRRAGRRSLEEGCTVHDEQRSKISQERFEVASVKPGGISGPRAGRAGRARSPCRLPRWPGRRRRPWEIGRTSALTICARAGLQVERQQRDRGVVGHADGPAAEVDRASLTSAMRSPSILCWLASFVKCAVGGAVLRGRVGDQRDGHDGAERHPERRRGSLGSRARPAEYPGAAEQARIAAARNA